MPEYDPIVLRYSPETQLTVNNLPGHSKIRRQRDSVGQSLVNAVFGVHADALSKDVDRVFHDHFLELASLDQPDIVWSTPIAPNTEFGLPVMSKNLLRNSSFEIYTNQLRLPDWWYVKTYIPNSEWLCYPYALVAQNGFIGDNCIALHCNPFTKIGISQLVPDRGANSLRFARTDPIQKDVVTPFKAGQELVASMYYWVGQHDMTSGVDTDMTLVVLAYDVDGNVDDLSHVVGVVETDGWQRASKAFTLQKNYTHIEVGVVFNTGYYDDYFDLPPVPHVDNFQLEFAKRATKWVPFLNDKPFYQDKVHVYPASPVVSEFMTRAQHVPTKRDFWHAVPTRITLEGRTSLEAAAVSGVTGYTYEVDNNKDQWRIEWVLKTHGGIQYICKVGVSPQDIYGWYQLALPTYNGNFGIGTKDDPDNYSLHYNYDTTIAAMTYFQGKIWAVGPAYHYVDVRIWKDEGEEYDIKETMCLFVIDPTTWHPEPNHLEVLAVLALPSWPHDDGSWPITAHNATRVEFRRGDQQHIFISSDDPGSGARKVYRYRLHYDYFTVEQDTRMAYFRENYEVVAVQPMVDPQANVAEVRRRS
jgi:hypothetical protein